MEIIGEMIASRTPHLLATANVDFLAQVQSDDILRRILVDADLIVCDGTPLIWMSRLLGDPLPERIAGSDLVPLLLDFAQKKGHRVFFLGGRDEVVAVAEEKIRERWPDLQIAGMYSPPFAPMDRMDHAGICRRIREANADML
ncbi:MAG: WecB/TagA/CpsF family glycosyltransferase, partial [Akkermansiaceae bacterium]